MIEFKEVSIVPQTVNTKQQFHISIKIEEKPSIFRFPLAIDKITGLIFKARNKLKLL